MSFLRKNVAMPTADAALSGRDAPMPGLVDHLVLGTPLTPPFPDGTEQAIFGMGCFWGAERLFWEAPGMYTTAAGYAGGLTPESDLPGGLLRPDRAHRGRARRIRLVGDDATRRCCGSSGRGTTRPRGCGRETTSVPSTAPRSSGRATRNATLALASRERFQAELTSAGYGSITTEIAEAGPFYYAEPYHQQYLAANPNGYCGLGGTGVSCPIGTGVTTAG